MAMTCNPKWKAITITLLPRQKASDKPDICARAIHIKLKALLHVVKNEELFVTTVAWVSFNFEKKDSHMSITSFPLADSR